MKRSLYIGRRTAFTLVELLAVIGVFLLLFALTVPAFNSLQGARGLTKTSNDVAAILEQAKTYAMAHNTYVWVGFQQEGEDTLVVGTIASKTGTVSMSADVVPLGNVVRFENVKIVEAPGVDERPGASDAVQLSDAGDSAFAFTLGNSAREVVFGPRIIQWNSRGEARSSSTQLSKIIEIGLQAFVGNVRRNPADYAAIQVTGLSGSVSVHRP